MASKSGQKAGPVKSSLSLHSLLSSLSLNPINRNRPISWFLEFTQSLEFTGFNPINTKNPTNTRNQESIWTLGN